MPDEAGGFAYNEAEPLCLYKELRWGLVGRVSDREMQFVLAPS